MMSGTRWGRVWVRVSAVPFQVAILLTCAGRGITAATGLLPTAVSTEALPWLVQRASLTELAVGSVIALAGIAAGHGRLERAGLIMLCPSAAIYALALFSVDPRHTTVSLIVYGCTSIACYLRVREVRQADTIVDRILSNGGTL